MIIELADVGSEGLDVSGAVPEEVLESRADDPVRCTGSIQCELHCQIVDREFLVDGSLSTALEMRCRRCDVVFTGRLDDLAYHYDQELDPMPESVDLTEDIREAILLALPLYPVCRESCKGLCPQCGTNWNEGICACRPPADVRWGALEGLGLGKE
ncbi:MAG: YceD family protein [Kiritimatiellia bacterium]